MQSLPYPTSALKTRSRRLNSFYSLDAAHVWPKHLWHGHRAVRLLVVLQHGNEDARKGETGAVERVRVLQATALLAPEADIGAAGLEVGTVRAGGDLQPFAAPGGPELDV